MSLSNFVDGVGPVVPAAYFNALDLIRNAIVANAGGVLTIAPVLASGNAGPTALTLAANGQFTLAQLLILSQGASITGNTSISGGTFASRGILDSATTNLLTLTAGGAIQGFGPLAAALLDLTPDSSSFVGTPTGGTGYSPATVTITWRRMGSLVGMTIPATQGTSTAGTFTITGSIPASILPANVSKFIPVSPLLNNGGNPSAMTAVNISTGVLAFVLGASGGAWTASGTKGISSPLNFVYSLD